MSLVSFVVLLCVFSLHQTIKIDGHVTRDYNEGLLSLHSNAESFIDSTWMLRIKEKHRDSRVDPMLDVLKETVTKDGCILLYSGISNVAHLFKIYCHNTRIDDNITNEHITIEMVLPHTVNDYLYRYFDKNLVMTENNKLFRRPHFFYGNDHMLQYAARMDANKGRSDKEGDLSHIMMPSSDAMDRIKAMNYIETNVGWDLDRIDQHAGMLDQRYQYILNAPDVDIYIIDTGIRVTHSEFEGRATFLINTVGDNIDTDMAGHGTFCASEAAGKTFGVAKKAHLYAVKVLDSLGDGDLFTIQAGIIQVIETARLNSSRRAVASLSLGGTKSAMLESAVALLTENGIVVSVSAGNSGADSCLYSPAALGGIPSANVLTVGATDINDYRPAWSNYGSCVSISAPGASITAAWYTGDTATRSLSGTSMATPLVAGAAALVLQQDMTKSVADVKSVILAWATPNIVDYASITGGGKNLLYSLIDLSVVPPPLPAPSPSVIVIGLPSTDPSSAASSSSHVTLFLLIITTLLPCFLL